MPGVFLAQHIQPLVGGSDSLHRGEPIDQVSAPQKEKQGVLYVITDRGENKNRHRIDDTHTGRHREHQRGGIPPEKRRKETGRRRVLDQEKRDPVERHVEVGV